MHMHRIVLHNKLGASCHSGRSCCCWLVLRCCMHGLKALSKCGEQRCRHSGKSEEGTGGAAVHLCPISANLWGGGVAWWVGGRWESLCVTDGRGHPAVKRTRPSWKHFHLSAAGKAAGRPEGRTDGRRGGGIYKPINSLDLIPTDKYASTTMRGALFALGRTFTHYITISSWLPVDFHKVQRRGLLSAVTLGVRAPAKHSHAPSEDLWIGSSWDPTQMYQRNTGPCFTSIISLSFNSLCLISCFFFMWQVFAMSFKQVVFRRNLLIYEFIFEVALPENGSLAKRNINTDQILIWFTGTCTVAPALSMNCQV